jgi:thiamine-monophosphate kinase
VAIVQADVTAFGLTSQRPYGPSSDMTRPSEDDLIARYFRPLATDPGAFRLGDDCATLRAPDGLELVLKTDAIAEGIHFFADDPWRAVAQKALRVNLSELGYLLSIALPADWTEPQLADFTAGLAADQETYSISLLGGDTIRSPKGLVITITVIGAVPIGRMARRGGAHPGDLFYVSGTIGDAALGLQLRLDRPLQDRLGLTDDQRAYLLDRYLLPQPRSALAATVLAHASGAMDISDGLVLDLTRMARVSGVDAELDAGSVPYSRAARAVIAAEPVLRKTALTGGDDYELLLAIPPDRTAQFEVAAREAGVAVTRVGRATAGRGNVRVVDPSGSPLDLSTTGFSHF